MKNGIVFQLPVDFRVRKDSAIQIRTMDGGTVEIEFQWFGRTETEAVLRAMQNALDERAICKVM